MGAGETLHLPDVTLVAITSVDIDETNAVLQHCLGRTAFGGAKLLCSELPQTPDRRIEYLRIPAVNLEGYNWIVLRLLHRYIDTSHCLIVQPDGFIVAPERWEQAFLDYDYIGAPWPAQIFVRQTPEWTLDLDRNRVGNGGFSLRSKKLLDAVARIPADALTFRVMNEDVVICHYLHDTLTAAGITYAPLELAARFAVETEEAVPGLKLGTTFGFHGKHLLERAEALIAGDRPCLCGSGKPFADCHGRLWN